MWKFAIWVPLPPSSMSSVDQENPWLELERREQKQGPTALTEGAVDRDASAERSSVYNRARSDTPRMQEVLLQSHVKLSLG